MKKTEAQIVLDIYQEMYEKSNPKADFKDMMEKGLTSEPYFFMAYYLPEETQEEIIKKHTKGLRRYIRDKIYTTVMLGCSPTWNLSAWKTERIKLEGPTWV